MKKPKITKKNVFITILIVAALSSCGFIALAANFGGKDANTPEITAMALNKTIVRDTISLSGTVYSAKTQNVYSTLSYPVKEILIKEGDRVNAGDLLAVLDVSDLEFEIRQAENNYESALLSASEEERSLEESISGSSISAQSALLSLNKAESNYKTLLTEYQQGTSAKLVSEKNSVDTAARTLENAKTSLEQKKRDYDTNKLLFDAGAVSQSELLSYETAYNNAATELDTAERQYKNAVASYESTQKTLESDLNTAKLDVESARLNYQNAQNNLSGVQSKTSTGSFSLEGQRISLEKLHTQLENASVTAGISGVVTEVNAVVGASASGILFVIEDDKDLYVSVKVKEYNLSKVRNGQSAIITSDATDRDSLRGEVSYVASKADAAGESTTVEFETHAKISEPDERVKIGMNAFVNIIVAEAADVYAVAPEAVVSGQGGARSVYAVENGVVVNVPVTVGLETATSVEISGNLNDGMLIISNPSDTSPGSAVEPNIIQTGAAFMRGSSGEQTGEPRMDGTGMERGQQGGAQPVMRQGGGSAPAGRAAQ